MSKVGMIPFLVSEAGAMLAAKFLHPDAVLESEFEVHDHLASAVFFSSAAISSKLGACQTRTVASPLPV